MYLDASVGAGQLGELDAAAVVHVPQTHLSENKHQDILRVTACILVFFMDHFYILILVQTAAA